MPCWKSALIVTITVPLNNSRNLFWNLRSVRGWNRWPPRSHHHVSAAQMHVHWGYPMEWSLLRTCKSNYITNYRLKSLMPFGKDCSTDHMHCKLTRKNTLTRGQLLTRKICLADFFGYQPNFHTNVCIFTGILLYIAEQYSLLSRPHDNDSQLKIHSHNLTFFPDFVAYKSSVLLLLLTIHCKLCTVDCLQENIHRRLGHDPTQTHSTLPNSECQTNNHTNCSRHWIILSTKLTLVYWGKVYNEL